MIDIVGGRLVLKVEDMIWVWGAAGRDFFSVSRQVKFAVHFFVLLFIFVVWVYYQESGLFAELAPVSLRWQKLLQSLCEIPLSLDQFNEIHLFLEPIASQLE